MASAIKKDKPRYKHDCEKCVFLGRINDDDLYYCKCSDGSTSYIARHSNDPSDNSSACDFNDDAYKQTRRMTGYPNWKESDIEEYHRTKIAILYLYCSGYLIFGHIIGDLKRQLEWFEKEMEEINGKRHKKHS